MRPFTKLFLTLFALFSAVFIAALVLSCFTPYDFVITSDYVVIDTGHVLIVSTKYGMCVPVDRIYLPVDTVKHFLHILHVKMSNLETFLTYAYSRHLLNVTVSNVLGKFNGTYVCGLAVFRYS